MIQAAGLFAARRRSDQETLSSLGLTREQRFVAAAVPVALVGAPVAAIVSIAVAVAGSTFTPVGSAASYEPRPGLELNLLITGAGAIVVAVSLVLGAAWIANAARSARRCCQCSSIRRRTARSRRHPTTGSGRGSLRAGTGQRPDCGSGPVHDARRGHRCGRHRRRRGVRRQLPSSVARAEELRLSRGLRGRRRAGLAGRDADRPPRCAGSGDRQLVRRSRRRLRCRRGRARYAEGNDRADNARGPAAQYQGRGCARPGDRVRRARRRR